MPPKLSAAESRPPDDGHHSLTDEVCCLRDELRRLGAVVLHLVEEVAEMKGALVEVTAKVRRMERPQRRASRH